MVSSLGDALNEFKEINFIQYYSVNIHIFFCCFLETSISLESTYSIKWYDKMVYDISEYYI